MRFVIHSVANHQKSGRGPFGGKKVSQCRKKYWEPLGIEKTEKGTLESRPVLYGTRKKRKTFLVQFSGPTGTI